MIAKVRVEQSVWNLMRKLMWSPWLAYAICPIWYKTIVPISQARNLSATLGSLDVNPAKTLLLFTRNAASLKKSDSESAHCETAISRSLTFFILIDVLKAKRKMYSVQSKRGKNWRTGKRTKLVRCHRRRSSVGLFKVLSKTGIYTGLENKSSFFLLLRDLTYISSFNTTNEASIIIMFLSPLSHSPFVSLIFAQLATLDFLVHHQVGPDFMSATTVK